MVCNDKYKCIKMVRLKIVYKFFCCMCKLFYLYNVVYLEDIIYFGISFVVEVVIV